MPVTPALKIWIENPARNKSELITARREHMNDPMVLDLIEEQLDAKWPSWNDKHDMHRGGGRTITHAHFMQEKRTFPTAKLAYVWLVESMLESRHKMNFSEISVVVANGEKGGHYIAQTLEGLFPEESEKQKDQNNWQRLANGLFLNLNLSNKQKLERLMLLAVILKFQYENDWTWDIEGSAESDLPDFDA